MYIDSVVTTNYPEIRIVFSVLKSGSIISNLNLSDIDVEEDGSGRSPILIDCSDTTSSSDVSVLLLIDRSGSMIGNPISDAKQAAISFINQLRAVDEAAVMTFETDVQLLQGFTTDKTPLIQAIQSIRVGDKTNLWGACIRAIDETALRSKRKAIVLLTDGYNSPEFFVYTVDSVAARAKQLGIPFYTIGLSAAVDSIGLQSLANETGGSYFSTYSSIDLEEIYNEIARIISRRGKCSLTYRSVLPCLDGKMHTVRLGVFASGMYAEAVATFTAPYDPSTLYPVKIEVEKNPVIEQNQRKSIALHLAQFNPSLPPHAFDFDVMMDTSLIQVEAIESTSNTTGYTSALSRVAGGYHITYSGQYPVKSESDILRLRLFAANSTMSQKTTLALRNFSIRDACAFTSSDQTIITISGSCQRATVRESSIMTNQNMLYPNSPNPFNPTTRLTFSIAGKGKVTLRLFDSLGEEVRTLVDSFLEAGIYSHSFDGKELPSGIYFYKLEAPGFTSVKRMVLLK